MDKGEKSKEEEYQVRLDHAKGFGDVYEIVKETVKQSLGEYRVGMMLYLDDLPLHLGAYHPVGTNNIVLNRSILNIIEASTQSRQTVNAFVYNILLHEYLHALLVGLADYPAQAFRLTMGRGHFDRVSQAAAENLPGCRDLARGPGADAGTGRSPRHRRELHVLFHQFKAENTVVPV